MGSTPPSYSTMRYEYASVFLSFFGHIALRNHIHDATEHKKTSGDSGTIIWAQCF